MTSWDDSRWRDDTQNQDREWKDSRWEDRRDNADEWKESRWEDRRDNGNSASSWQETSREHAWNDSDRWKDNGDSAQNRWQETAEKPSTETQPTGDPWHDSGDPWGGHSRQTASSSSTSPAPGRYQDAPQSTNSDMQRGAATSADVGWNVNAPEFQPHVADTAASAWPSWDTAQNWSTGSTPQEAPRTESSGNDMSRWDGTTPCSTGSPQQHARQRDFKLYQDWYIENNVRPQDDAEKVDEVEEELFKLGLGGGAGIDFALYDDVPCQMSMSTGKLEEGKSFPVLKTFAEIIQHFPGMVPEELEQNIKRCGYDRPTPVQKYSIPVGLAGRDVMCCAQTGSGKTVAFLVPILASMIKNHRAIGNSDAPFTGPCKPDTLILSPTRELCLQIYRETLKFCHKTPHRAVRVYGQEDARTQIKEVAKGADIIVATPGRLWDFVNSGIVQVTQVECLVIDEADIMISKQMDGFIKDVVENYGMPDKEGRQTMMFSATFPAEIQKMAIEYLYDHVWIGIGPVGGASSTVTQTVELVEHEKKFERLLDLLLDFLEKKPDERLIVFTNTKLEAKGLDDKLWEHKINTGALHGDLTQVQREENLQKFRSGDVEVLVATDLAARGLDIGGVTHVINYDVPRDIDTYVQRIGRTGRIGRRGYAITYVTAKDGKFLDDVSILKAMVMKMDESKSLVPDWLAEAAREQSQESWNNWDQREQHDARDPQVRGSWNQGSQHQDQAQQGTWNYQPEVASEYRPQEQGSWGDWQ